ncbi:MAG: Type prenyl endopeptidase Rce1-like [Chloroflexota bacterium]|nr:Type prenyl endopeptidase Rce1-like [Chloroflexota bacterium]
MTTVAARPSGSLSRPVVIVVGLAAIVGLRWAATISAAADAIAIGLIFGLGLLGLAAIAGWRPASERRSSLVIGVAGGGVLVVLAMATRASLAPSLAPPGPFVPWAGVTVLVASAEEILLRGALFDELERTIGVGLAVVATSLVFALMHVPLYGWGVLPLDFGVGLWFAGLRLATGGIAAPAMAHAMADLATWWL